MKLSILVPLFNEEGNIDELYRRIDDIAPKFGVEYEVLAVDDGSTDATFSHLQSIATRDPHWKVLRFRRNFGQTAALSAALRYSSGEWIVMMDGDLQNDPRDIPLLLAKLVEGYDVASGWRKERRDPFWSRRLPSTVANRLISALTDIKLHDFGCTLKAYRFEVIRDVRLYGEMHRFLPFLAALRGAKICEVPVTHHRRQSGRSKYGLNRTFKVILDLLTLKFLGFYAQSPIYLFGGIGCTAILIGILVAGLSLYQKFAFGVFVHRNPLILLATFLALGGLQFVVLGLLAELLLRTYHESQDKPIYVLRDSINVLPEELKPPLKMKVS